MSGEGQTSALRCRGVSKRFGALLANDRVDFDVRQGEIHALVGENGAGKTTLMNILYGVLSPDEGIIEVRGTPVTFHTCADAMHAGIGMVFQHYLLVERFTVAENVLLGCEPTARGFLDKNAAQASVRDVAQRYRFAVDPSSPVEALGVGARQQVELLRVLKRAPNIIILDEPTAALSPDETNGLFDVMDGLRKEGRAVIFITHKLKEVMRLSDRITVLRRGRVIGTLNREGADESTLASMMIGASAPSAVGRADSVALGASVLELCNLVVARSGGGVAIDGLSLSLRAGETIGIAGVEGNGQSELAEALYGLRPITSGSVVLGGADLTHAPVRVRRKAGLRYIPPDRQGEGLVLDFDAVENSLLGEKALPGTGLLDLATGRERAQRVASEFAIAGYQPPLPIRSYSGGTQQKFLVGRETDGQVRVVVAFAPTRGVDIGAAESIYQRLRDMQAQGTGIILISYDLDEIRALSDRIVVLHRGQAAGEVAPALADDVTLGRLMGGLTQ